MGNQACAPKGEALTIRSKPRKICQGFGQPALGIRLFPKGSWGVRSVIAARLDEEINANYDLNGLGALNGQKQIRSKEVSGN